MRDGVIAAAAETTNVGVVPATHGQCCEGVEVLGKGRGRQELVANGGEGVVCWWVGSVCIIIIIVLQIPLFVRWTDGSPSVRNTVGVVTRIRVVVFRRHHKGCLGCEKGMQLNGRICIEAFS